MKYNCHIQQALSITPTLFQVTSQIAASLAMAYVEQLSPSLPKVSKLSYGWEYPKSLGSFIYSIIHIPNVKMINLFVLYYQLNNLAIRLDVSILRQHLKTIILLDIDFYVKIVSVQTFPIKKMF